MPDKDQKEFTFMSEQLKKKPFYKKRWFQKGLGAGALAVIFGMTAGVTFAVIQPWAKKQFGEPEDPAKVFVVREETETETAPPQTETQEKAVPQTVIEQKDLEIADYKMLYEKMAEVAESVSPAIVTVTCETSNLDWFNEVIENHVQASGLVIAQNQEEYFILTEGQALDQAERTIVTFSDGMTVEASLQKQDSVTGLAVVRVLKSELSEETKNIIPAKLSPSEMIKKGEPVIALGTPVSNETSMSFGMVTSVVDTPAVDSQYNVLSTDILGSEQGSGILVDLDGDIVGIIAQNFSAGNSQITLTALAAYDIQGLVTDLANNKERPRIGITGKEIDAAIAKEFDMPEGIYVRSVAEDSPAMYAGVYEADIITSIDSGEIRTIDEYEEEIQRHSPDEYIKLGIKRATMDGYVDIEVPVQLGRR
jgi:serine protease Do